jgi:hypothetical protein
MPEFTENQDRVADERRGLAPDRSQSRPRRRRNPISSSHKGRERSQCGAVGPCVIDCGADALPDAVVAQSAQTANGRYSTEMVGEEAIGNGRRSGEHRFRHRAEGRNGSESQRKGGRKVIARRPHTEAPHTPKATPGPMGRIFRALWPFGKRRTESNRQDGQSRSHSHSAPRRRRGA